jgi:sodium transport system ATP-binding protein
MIEIAGLRKRFGHVEAVRDVTFEAADGSVTGLLGPNGAGKTTTLRMLSGLMAPDAGHIQVDGIDAIADPQRARQVMGLLPDSRGLYPRLTPREHIRYFGELHGLTGPEIAERSANLLKRLGLESIADRRVAGFSQGERTKVALARALVHGPRNVILDEPTNGLDVMSTRAMRALIRALRQDGCCVVFSSHIMQEVSALCDRIVVIAQGIVVAQGAPDDLRRRTGEPDLEDAFVALAGLEAEEVE